MDLSPSLFESCIELNAGELIGARAATAKNEVYSAVRSFKRVRCITSFTSKDCWHIEQNNKACFHSHNEQAPLRHSQRWLFAYQAHQNLSPVSQLFCHRWLVIYTPPFGYLDATIRCLLLFSIIARNAVFARFCHASVISSSPELVPNVGNSSASMSSDSSSVAELEADSLSNRASFFCDDDPLFPLLCFGTVM